MIYKQLLPWAEDDLLEFVRFECSTSFNAKMYTGHSLKSEKSPEIYIKDPTKRPPDFLSGLGSVLPIVSTKVREFLENSEDSKYLEFIEPVLINYNKTEGYYILNILDVLDAFDWDNSDYDVFDEPGPKGNKVIRKVRRIVFKEEIIGGRNLFYIKEFPGIIYISQRLESELKKADIGNFRTLEI